uniref:Uncharacterized protein n=1 Tax=Syphacia muris TaxID=451379 RepID=A0A0N5ATL8_9BILA
MFEDERSQYDEVTRIGSITQLKNMKGYDDAERGAERKRVIFNRHEEFSHSGWGSGWVGERIRKHSFNFTFCPNGLFLCMLTDELAMLLG